MVVNGFIKGSVCWSRLLRALTVRFSILFRCQMQQRLNDVLNCLSKQIFKQQIHTHTALRWFPPQTHPLYLSSKPPRNVFKEGLRRVFVCLTKIPQKSISPLVPLSLPLTLSFLLLFLFFFLSVPPPSSHLQCLGIWKSHFVFCVMVICGTSCSVLRWTSA